MSEAEPTRPIPPGDADLNRRLARRRRWARSVLALEAVIDAFAPALAVVVAFLVLALFGVLQLMPWWLHGLVLVGLVAGLAWSIRLGWRRWRRVDEAAVDRRLERAAGLAHQPIQAVGDRPATGADPAAERLWVQHQARERARLAALPRLFPRSVLTTRDPWALRAVAGLALFVAVIDAGPAWRDRLAAAAVPSLGPAVAAAPMRLDLWLTPPLYTGQSPVVRTVALPLEANGEALVVPASSELVLQLHDVPEGRVVETAYALAPLDVRTLGAHSFEMRTVLRESGALELQSDSGALLARFPIEVKADRLPVIQFVEPPTVTQRQALATRFEASDDYGLAAIELELALTARPEMIERVSLRQFARARLTYDGAAFSDLTPHPFAGQEVVVRLVATDVADQEGSSSPLRIVLPERQFSHPVARAIIAARRQLVAEPEERRTVAAQLNILAQGPRVEALDTVVPLALRAASTRLVLNRDGSADRSAMDLLWDTALFVEEGQLAVAERDLRALEQALQEALERGADDAELQALMDELQAALDAFLEALMRQALEQMQGMSPEDLRMQPSDQNAQMLDRQDFQDMLDAMREAMQSGAMEQAQQMLSQLRQLLENMQMAMQLPMMGQMQQNMGALQELIREQQRLMDQTFQRQQQGQDGQPGQNGQDSGQGQAGMDGLQQQQEALRRALGELMRQLGESGAGIPDQLGQSELEMRGAEQALGEGLPGRATGSQAEALDLLQQGAGELMEQMQQMGQMPGGEPGGEMGMGAPLQGTRDPLGRPLRNQGGATPFGVEVPDAPDLGTARDVLRELHRRSGERDRPALELDYFERLLRRF
ncbi:MAG: TIGR02302 family protein [Geminicoccaceae bacterium]|nr:MAG: TIGR02302 family protein [Geminicoccaceae bacterium]